ncbi:hypothetical protein J6590_058263 [Homalodisca vitripennis]|nr:hypothetical protein J6590_058263 [Homalodisca vitripennis]
MQSTVKDLRNNTNLKSDESGWLQHFYFIDYSYTDLAIAEGSKVCPKVHKDIPDLVKKIQLATGISEKNFNLPMESSLSINPYLIVGI